MITCIIVDDDVNTVKVFSDLLGFLGLDVLDKGHSGSEAVSLYKKHNPDIVFIDIMMPITDGFYAIKEIRNINPASKIVAITADVSEKTKKMLDDLCISAIIYKPFSGNQIKKVLIQEYKIKL